MLLEWKGIEGDGFDLEGLGSIGMTKGYSLGAFHGGRIVISQRFTKLKKQGDGPEVGKSGIHYHSSWP